MNKKLFKGREYTFMSCKNNCPVTVIGEAARLAATKLESDERICSYQTKVLWESCFYLLNSKGIRKTYLEGEWTSDFLIQFLDGTELVLETISEKALFKLSEIEKLELSKRYWSERGIQWAVFVKREDGRNIYDEILGIQ